MTDEGLRRAYQAGTSADPMGRRGCPDAEAISALVEREGKEDHRLALLDHVMTCSACRRDFELLRAVHVASPGAGRRRFQPLALAASVALLVGLGGLGMWSMFRTDQPDLQRNTGAEVEVVAPASGAVVKTPVLLAWRPVSGAFLYTVELLTDDDRLIHSWATADTNVIFPDSGGPTVQAGSYAWWVRARLTDGAERRSPVVRFVVR
jgi:hypothetical protein